MVDILHALDLELLLTIEGGCLSDCDGCLCGDIGGSDLDDFLSEDLYGLGYVFR